MKNGVCIIECLDDCDPGSEGRLLREVFKLMQVDSELVRVSSIADLLSAVENSCYQHIHVSTHGAVTENNKFRGWWTHKGSGTRRTVEQQEIKLKCTSIVSSACLSGSNGFAKYVTDPWGSKYYIAPTGSPSFYNATLFSHIYYHKLIKTKRVP